MKQQNYLADIHIIYDENYRALIQILVYGPTMELKRKHIYQLKDTKRLLRLANFAAKNRLWIDFKSFNLWEL